MDRITAKMESTKLDRSPNPSEQLENISRQSSEAGRDKNTAVVSPRSSISPEVQSDSATATTKSEHLLTVHSPPSQLVPDLRDRQAIKQQELQQPAPDDRRSDFPHGRQGEVRTYVTLPELQERQLEDVRKARSRSMRSGQVQQRSLTKATPKETWEAREREQEAASSDTTLSIPFGRGQYVLAQPGLPPAHTHTLVPNNQIFQSQGFPRRVDRSGAGSIEESEAQKQKEKIKNMKGPSWRTGDPPK